MNETIVSLEIDTIHQVTELARQSIVAKKELKDVRNILTSVIKARDEAINKYEKLNNVIFHLLGAATEKEIKTAVDQSLIDDSDTARVADTIRDHLHDKFACNITREPKVRELMVRKVREFFELVESEQENILDDPLHTFWRD